MQKKSQFSIEFILIFSIAFIVFLFMIVLITRYMDYAQIESDKQKMGILAENIKKNIVLAYQSGQGFEVEVTIPREYDGHIVNISAEDDVLYVKNNVTNYVVTRSIPVVNGNFKLGCNKITKEDGVINIGNC